MSTIVVGIYQLDPDDAFVAEFPLLWTETLSRDLRVASIGEPQIISINQAFLKSPSQHSINSVSDSVSYS